MKKTRVQDPAKTVDTYCICVIYHKKSRRIFIDLIHTRNIARAYRDHFSMKNNYTKKLFVNTGASNPLPQMYMIDSFGCVPTYAYTRQLIWIRYFISKGFICINSKNEIQCCRDIYDESGTTLKEIMNKNLADILTAENEVTADALSNYNSMDATDTDKEKERICTTTFKCKLSDRKIFQKHARKLGVPMATYLTKVGVAGNVIMVDYSIVKEHVKVLSQYQQELEAVLKLLIDQQQLDDATVKKILDIIYQTYESEKNFLQAFIDEESSRKKYIFEQINKEHFGGKTVDDL